MSRFTLLVVFLLISNGCSLVPGTIRSRSIVAPTLKKLDLEDGEIPVAASTDSTGEADPEPEREQNQKAEVQWSPDDLMIGSATKANLEGQRFAMSQRWEPAFEAGQTPQATVEVERTAPAASATKPHPLRPLTVDAQIATPTVQSAYVASVAESMARDEEAAPSTNEPPSTSTDIVPTENPLDQLFSQLQLANHLHLSRVCLCRQVDGFGQVVEFSDTQFAAGEDVLIYCEVDNFTSQSEPMPAGSCHRTSLSGSYLVINGDGEVVAEQEYPVVNDVSRAERDDFFLVFPAQIPLLGPGRYRMYLVVHDELGRELVAHAEPIRFQIALTGQAHR